MVYPANSSDQRPAENQHRPISLPQPEGQALDQSGSCLEEFEEKSRVMTLARAADEFIRRFLLHVLPKGFVRIRHFGCMANYRRSDSFALCRRLLDVVPGAEPNETTSSDSSWSCPHCQGPMTLIQRFTARQLARLTFLCDTS